jgi:hypothetical protein
VHQLIKKLKAYYTIFPGFENIKNIKICILLGNNHEKTIKLKFCNIRKEYLIDIQREYIKKLRYIFYFVVNGVRSISKNYPVIKSKNLKYNIINFKDIQDTELLLEDQYDKEIEYYYNSHSSSETNSKSSKDSTENLCYNNQEKLFEKTIKYGLRNANSQIEINVNLKIKKVKSILKKRQLKRERSSKKVSFGKIEVEN